MRSTGSAKELLVIDDGNRSVTVTQRQSLTAQNRWKRQGLPDMNIVRVKRLDEHSIEIPDWGTRLHLEQEIDAEITPYRASVHTNSSRYGAKEDNCIPVKEKGKAEFPFEWKYFLKR